MPGPPTPVSACPLKRLEIRDGPSTKTYTSKKPTNVFTLTLEGERAVDAETGTLILLLHHGQQRLVSIRLTDLLNRYPTATDTVSIDRLSQQLCIKIPGQNHAVLAQFEEKRDFTVALCLLKKSHFHISEPIVSTLQPACLQARTVSPSTPSASPNPGQRLSSFMRPRYSPSSAINIDVDNPLDGSSTSIFNPTFPTWMSPSQELHGVYHQHETEPEVTASPVRAFNFQLDQKAVNPQLNPYHIFLNKREELHKPRVGSPLKKSFHPDQPAGHLSNAFELHQSGFHGASDFCGDLGFSSFQAEPFTTVQTSGTRTGKGQSDTQVTATHNSQETTITPSEPSQDFRDFLPRRRKLPFDPSIKRTKEPKLFSRRYSTSAISPSCSSPVDIVTRQDPQTQLKMRYVDRGTYCEGMQGGEEESSDNQKSSQRAMSSETTDVGSQTEQSQDSGNLDYLRCSSKAESVTSPPYTTATPPAVLLTDPGMLQAISNVTSTLFDQYQSDVQEGSDKAVSAKFYMDQILAARKSFWYKRLAQLSSREGKLNDKLTVV